MDTLVVIVGVNGNAFDVLEMMGDVNRTSGGSSFQCIGFLDDDPALCGQKFMGVEVLGDLGSAKNHGDCLFVNAIGNENNFPSKASILSRLGVGRERFLTLVHPTAYVSSSARLGKGVVVLQNVTVASNARIGDHVMILPNSVISHDCIIGDHTCIAGGVSISGEVTIRDACYLGTGSCLRSRITVGPRSLVGMGSVVLRNVPENTVVVGNPAKYLRPTV